MKSTFLLGIAYALAAGAVFAAENPAGIPAHYKLVYAQTFDGAGALKDFVATDPAWWRLRQEGTNGCLELVAPGTDASAEPVTGPVKGFTYQPKYRSPYNICLLANQVLSDFILDLDMQSTVKPYGHQDLCLFYGLNSPTEFYYTHIAVAADPRAHNIFIVQNADRRSFASQTTQGITWGVGVWHKVRLEREVSSGTIRVYFDDLTKPIMRAEDKTFASGYVGFGSFDDLGRFDNLRLYAPTCEEKRAGFFKALAAERR